MLIDEAIITAEAGDGGDGRVSFFPNYGKPSGGDGGKGGNLYAVVDSNLSTLTKYVRTHTYHASNGKAGSSGTKDGKDGEHLTLHFPIGTQLIDTVTHESIELEEGKPPVLLCKGGQGGWGNASVSRKNQGVFATAYPGREGQKRDFHVIMRLIADCGLIGIPNAGKSSLLNVLTNANAKVANYPFTTLEPNLGILKIPISKKQDTNINRVILADIPGLIEGASAGKGLGDKFLKHIEKVKVILHCISCETTDLMGDYRKIHKELEEYNPALLAKKEIIVLTKADTLCDDTARQKLRQIAEGLASTVVFVSILDDTTISDLTDVIVSTI